jgi:hypothetical protein
VTLRAGLAVAAAAAVVAGCGGAKAPAAGLGWEGKPQVFLLKDLPTDRVLIGQVVNHSPKTLHLAASRLRVRDASGRVLKSSGAYTASFAHGLFGAFQQPSKLPQAEASRLGLDIYLIPKATSRFFAAWRIPAGSRGPFRVEYGSGPALEVPAEVKPASG